MAQDLRKKLSELLQKMDSKVVEAKLKQAVEMLKNGEHEDLAKKLSTMDKDDLLAKINELDNLNPDDLKRIQENVGSNVKNEDITAVQNKLNPEAKKLLEKIMSTLKIK
jgi:uncharacterized protein (DUF2267 family)